MSDKEIIGRTKEFQLLIKSLNSEDAEFIAVYGRRRVGKTFLVRSVFAKEKNYLEIIGKKRGKTHEQLKIFAKAFSERFLSNTDIQVKSWEKAFDLAYQQALKTNKKFILFLDELPWLASARSGLLEELEHCWNAKLSKLTNFKLIVCGSAASWIHKKIIHSKSGLHNRLTGIIALEPYSLKETKEYLIKKKKYDLGFDNLLDIYMCMGGIPFYLNWVEPGLSASQVLNNLCFAKSGILYKEFESLFASLFNNSALYENIVTNLANSRLGLSRKEISKRTHYPDGGGLTEVLFNLEFSGFIKKYTPFNQSNAQAYYRLVDHYSLFYINWIAKIKSSGLKIPEEYWLSKSNSQSFRIWSGYSFEIACFNHISLIQESLGIRGMAVLPSTWRGQGQKSQAQIDLVLDRADNIINLCEIKFRKGGLKISNDLRSELLRKQAIFQELTQTKRPVTSVIISSHGFLDNFTPDSAVSGIVSGEDFLL